MNRTWDLILDQSVNQTLNPQLNRVASIAGSSPEAHVDLALESNVDLRAEPDIESVLDRFPPLSAPMID